MVFLSGSGVYYSVEAYNDITLNIVVSYEEQSVKWDEEYCDRYFSIHEKADSVTFASAQYHPDCYSTAEQMMIDESDLLVICGKTGALSDTYKYAESQGREAFYYTVL